MAGAGPRDERLISYPVLDLRQYLLGAWSIDRALEDRLTESDGTFAGRADFASDGEGLLYREEGRLEMAGYADDVTRTYRWSFSAPERARLWFDDGRPFHELDLTKGRADVRHLCGDDVYDGVYDVTDEDRWRLTWEIKGPRKSLKIDSRYTRIGI